MYKSYLFLFFTLRIFSLFSQSGPAGVGSFTNNVLWLKADAGTSTVGDGAPVNSWADQSGNSINVSQNAAAQQPLYKANLMNGMPAIEFDNINLAGQNDFLSAADNSLLDNTNGYTAFSVVRMKTITGNGQSIFSKRTNVDADEAFMFFFHTGNHLYLDVDGLGDRFYSNSAYSPNANYLVGFEYDGTLASASRSRMMEGDSTIKTAPETSALVPDKVSPLVIGATHVTDTRAFAGYISEVILFRTALSNAERTVIYNYLSAKYDIPLQRNDKYAGDNTANGDFDKDVAGIGKESSGSSAMFNASTTKGLMLSVTAGLDNGDYIMAGHRQPFNGANTTDVAGMTGTDNARWERNWYIDVTNTSTTLTADIVFDFSDAGINAVPGTSSNYVLLYRPVNSGNWTELATSNTISGDQVVFSSYNLVNDGYYTLGGRNYPANTLPVSLLNFKAMQEGNAAKMQWATASEQNNHFFTIERSANAIDYKEIARINSKAPNGDSHTYLEYSFTDNSPLDGMNYYRLRQTDQNGETKLYAPLSLFCKKEKNSSFALFPNPGNGNCILNYQGVGDNQTISVAVIDMQGKKVYERSQPVQESDGHLEVIPEVPLAPGVYTMQVRSGSASQTLRMLVE
jgi:hypothetical protein